MISFRRGAAAALATAALAIGFALPASAATAGPKALAGPAHNASLTSVTAATTTTQAQAGGHASSFAGGASPFIKWNPLCAVGSRTTWVLIFEFYLPSRGVSHWCFGYTGTWYFPSNGLDQATYFCAGNNWGNIEVRWRGYVTWYSFSPGTRITWQPGSATLMSLTIDGWYGSNTCLV